MPDQPREARPPPPAGRRTRGARCRSGARPAARTAARRTRAPRSRSRRSGPGAAPASAMSATTALESIPPLRNAPSGTSVTSRQPHGVAEARQELRRRVGLRQRALGLVAEAPVPLEAHLAVLHQEVVRRRQLPDAGERRPGRRHVVVRQVVVTARPCPAAASKAGSARKAFGSEAKTIPSRVQPVVERLLAEPVAREQETAPPARPRARTRTCRGAARGSRRRRRRRPPAAPRCPSACGTGARATRARAAAPGSCRSPRCRTTRTRGSSAVIGWRAASLRSTMASRRWARPTASWCQNPSPSGPRWARRSPMPCRMPGSTGAPVRKFRRPAIPHTPGSSGGRRPSALRRSLGQGPAPRGRAPGHDMRKRADPPPALADRDLDARAHPHDPAIFARPPTRAAQPPRVWTARHRSRKVSVRSGSIRTRSTAKLPRPVASTWSATGVGGPSRTTATGRSTARRPSPSSSARPGASPGAGAPRRRAARRSAALPRPPLRAA